MKNILLFLVLLLGLSGLVAAGPPEPPAAEETAGADAGEAVVDEAVPAEDAKPPADQPAAAPAAPAVTDSEIDAIIDRLENKDELERLKAFDELKALGETALGRIVAYGIKRHHPAVVCRLAEALGDIHTPASAEALRGLLQSKVAEIVISAMDAIARHGNEKLVYEIMPLMSSENEMLRRKAVQVLGMFGFKSSVTGLLGLLKEGTYGHEKITALQILRKYPEMKDVIIGDVAPLLTADDPQLALEAAVTLKTLGDGRGEAFFRDLGKRDDAFQEQAIAYVGRYRITSASGFLLKQLKDERWYRRYIAVDALAAILDPLAMPSLKVLFESETVLPVRIALARTFYEYKDPESLDMLQHKIKTEPNADIRWFIVATIGTVGGDKAIWPLILSLTDSDEKIRLAAVISLRTITDQNFGYDHRAPAKERTEAATRWEQWYNRTKKN